MAHLILRKPKNTYVTDFPKLINVILSCVTKEQYRTAMTYIAAYRKFHLPCTNKVGGIFLNFIANRTLAYIQDTEEHIDKGYHKPDWNEYKTVTRYPDLNDYFEEVLDVKFKKVWQRGYPSVYTI